MMVVQLYYAARGDVPCRGLRRQYKLAQVVVVDVLHHGTGAVGDASYDSFELFKPVDVAVSEAADAALAFHYDVFLLF